MSFSRPLQYLSWGLSLPFLEGWAWTESGKSFLGGLMGRPLPTLRPVLAAMGWRRTGPPGLLTRLIPGGVSRLMPPMEEIVCMEVSWTWPPCPPFPRPTMCTGPDIPTPDMPTVKPMVEGVVVSALRLTPFFYENKKGWNSPHIPILLLFVSRYSRMVIQTRQCHSRHVEGLETNILTAHWSKLWVCSAVLCLQGVMLWKLSKLLYLACHS